MSCVTGYVHPPDLHSFPTRRSSDLCRHPEAVDDVARAELDQHGLARGDVQLVSGTRALRGQRIPVLDLPPPLVPDRKSTRLNSSHVEISYAVFCLKKKKKEIIS